MTPSAREVIANAFRESLGTHIVRNSDEWPDYLAQGADMALSALAADGYVLCRWHAFDGAQTLGWQPVSLEEQP